MSLLRKAVSALKWSVLGELGARVLGPLSFLVLAWKLAPDEFGVAAAAAILISFSQVVWDSGFSRALVQWQGPVDGAARVVFWLNLASAAFIGALLFVGAEPIARFFDEPRVASAVSLLVWQLPLSAAASVQAALLQRDLAFKRLFVARFLSALAAPALSVVLVFLNFGFWSLVIGALAGQAVQTAVLWRLSSWRPWGSIDAAVLKKVWQFGRWAMFAGFTGWVFGWVDSMILGHYLGPEALGLFRTGNNLVTMAFGLIFSPVAPVIYSLFSRSPDDLPRLREGLLFVVKAAAVIALPLAAWIFACSSAVAAALFPARWQGVSDVLGWMALVHGLSWLVGYNGDVYRAIGRPALESLVAAVLIVVYVVGLSAAAQYSMLAFLQVRLLIAVVALGMHVAVASRVIDLAAGVWLRAVSLPVLAALGSALLLTGAMRWAGESMAIVATATLLTAGLYGAYVAWAERAHVSRWRALLAGGRP